MAHPKKQLPLASKPFLKSITLKSQPLFPPHLNEEYPFNLPVVTHLSELVFHPDVTFLVGENGTGKSTLIEAIAIAMGFNAEGGTKHAKFCTENTHSNLHEYLRLSKGITPPAHGFFLRAESFYNLASYLEQINGTNLHQVSHGQAFLELIQTQFKLGQCLYILDEPEAALSANRQMTALVELDTLVQSGAQFIIATHSPILLAYPNCWIYQLNEQGFERVPYKETDTYISTKRFLDHPERMLKHLLDQHDSSSK